MRQCARSSIVNVGPTRAPRETMTVKIFLAPLVGSSFSAADSSIANRIRVAWLDHVRVCVRSVDSNANDEQAKDSVHTGWQRNPASLTALFDPP